MMEDESTVHGRKEETNAIYVGRSRGNQIVVKDRFMEPVHLVITKRHDQYHMRLYHGVGGTFTINNEQVTESFLGTGDRILVANSSLTVNTSPELFLDVHTFGQSRKSARWVIALFLNVALLVGGALFWPRLFPEFAVTRYMEQGDALFKKGEFDKASLSYRNILKLQQRNAEADFRLGLILEQQKNPAGAFKQFVTAIQNDPKHLASLLRVGRYSFITGHLDQAMGVVKRILAINPRHKESRTLKAVILAHQGKLNESISLSEQLLTEDPKQSES